MDKEPVRIGRFDIYAPKGHLWTMSLPRLYDYGPWSYLSEITNLSLNEYSLVDIGANIGDSICWWKSFNGGSVIAVEPATLFWSYLQMNADLFSDIDCRFGLVVGQYGESGLLFSSGNSTGRSVYESLQDNQVEEALKGNPFHSSSLFAYEGTCYSVCEILDRVGGRPMVFKSDTDGFDIYILQSLLAVIGEYRDQLDILFIEGPLKAHWQTGKLDEFFSLYYQLMGNGYHVSIFSNKGHPLAISIKNVVQLKRFLNIISASFKNDCPMCDYIDMVFYDESQIKKRIGVGQSIIDKRLCQWLEGLGGRE